MPMWQPPMGCQLLGWCWATTLYWGLYQVRPPALHMAPMCTASVVGNCQASLLGQSATSRFVSLAALPAIGCQQGNTTWLLAALNCSSCWKLPWEIARRQMAVMSLRTPGRSKMFRPVLTGHRSSWQLPILLRVGSTTLLPDNMYSCRFSTMAMFGWCGPEMWLLSRR